MVLVVPPQRTGKLKMKASNEQDKRSNEQAEKGAECKKSAAQNAPSLQSSSLRKGAGPIRGTRGNFAASSVTGTGSMTVPICTSPGRSGFGPQPMLSAYAVALVAVGGAVVATLELGSALKHTPIRFFCSVILSSWFGGVWPGIFAGLLSVIAMDYYFIPPIYALGISLEEMPDMVAFVASALLVSWLSGERKSAAALLFKRKGPRDSLPHPSTLCPEAESAFQSRRSLDRGITGQSSTKGRLRTSKRHVACTAWFPCLSSLAVNSMLAS
jgi:Domain of unknown function (DUF4118)